MRNLKLIDAVVALHEIASLVEHDVGVGDLSNDILKCADRLHRISAAERGYSVQARDAINKAKE